MITDEPEAGHDRQRNTLFCCGGPCPAHQRTPQLSSWPSGEDERSSRHGDRLLNTNVLLSPERASNHPRSRPKPWLRGRPSPTPQIARVGLGIHLTCPSARKLGPHRRSRRHRTPEAVLHPQRQYHWCHRIKVLNGR